MLKGSKLQSLTVDMTYVHSKKYIIREASISTSTNYKVIKEYAYGEEANREYANQELLQINELKKIIEVCPYLNTVEVR